jgi:hypothetical protein
MSGHVLVDQRGGAPALRVEFVDDRTAVAVGGGDQDGAHEVPAGSFGLVDEGVYGYPLPE